MRPGGGDGRRPHHRHGPAGTLIDDLIGRGFQREHEVRLATLEDVFLDLTGRSLREF